jgi:hypothetical protein
MYYNNFSCLFFITTTDCVLCEAHVKGEENVDDLHINLQIVPFMR